MKLQCQQFLLRKRCSAAAVLYPSLLHVCTLVQHVFRYTVSSSLMCGKLKATLSSFSLNSQWRQGKLAAKHVLVGLNYVLTEKKSNHGSSLQQNPMLKKTRFPNYRTVIEQVPSFLISTHCVSNFSCIQCCIDWNVLGVRILRHSLNKMILVCYCICSGHVLYPCKSLCILCSLQFQ